MFSNWSKIVENVRKRLSMRKKTSLDETNQMMSNATQRFPEDLQIGMVDGTDEMAVMLHLAAWEKPKRKSKKRNKLRSIIVAKEMDVDYANDLGQTPLFCACAANNEEVASLLLKYGADPNFKDHRGVTPILVTCYIGNIGLLCKMIEDGGDICVRDNKDQGILEWASKNDDFEVRNAMVAFLEQTRIYGLMSSAFDGDVICDSKIPNIVTRPLKETSVMELLHKTTGSDISVGSNESTGFGQVYPCTKESAAIVSVVPLMPESMLINMNNVTFDCSLDFTMREMIWLSTEVSVKMLKSEFEIQERASQIMAEASFLSKLHHPNVILLMALCQPNTLDMITLVFERVHNKNLYQYLHLENETLSSDQCVTLAIQLSSAMDYIHNQGFIHCGLSSNAVYLTSALTVKLGNFEFMTERSQADKGVCSSISYLRNISDLYYWMSPELMCGHTPAFQHDVFSFSCVFWEMFAAEVPWSWISKEDLLSKAFISEDFRQLPLNTIPRDLRKVIETGLKRKQSSGVYFKYVYNFLKNENTSQNSLSGDSSVETPSKNFAKGKSPPQDKLVFGSRCLQTQRRHFKSTSAINPNNEAREYSRIQFDKNSSESDLLLLKGGSCFTAPAIKPASHHHQPELVVKTCPGLCGQPNIGLAKRRKSSNSSLEDHLGNDDDDDDDDVEINGGQKITCVKQLAEGYQQRIIQHKLRQAILKGSMAPQGSCEDGDSPLNQSRWCSLPSTIKELSKLWSSREESTKMCLSDIGNLSCTPQSSKQTSTPLRRNLNKSDPSCVAVVEDYFRRQRTLRNVGTNCRFDEINLELQEEDRAMKQKGDVMEEMKIIQTHWKRFVTEADEDQSSHGVSYQSPVIEFRKKKKNSVADKWNDVSLQTEDMLYGQSSSDCKDVSYLNTPGKEEKGKSQGVDQGENTADDMSCELETGGRVVKEDGRKTVSFDEGVLSSVEKDDEPAGKTKDSFWDVTLSTWSGKQSLEEMLDKNDVLPCLEEETIEVTLCSNENSSDNLIVSKDETGFDDVNVSHSLDENVKKVIGNETGDKAIDSTFCVKEEDNEEEEMDLNTTFTLDADGTEPDSWFTDIASSDGLSHWVADQLDMIKQEMMTKDCKKT